MIVEPYKNLMTVVLIFCCIFTYTIADISTMEESDRDICKIEEVCMENEEEHSELHIGIMCIRICTLWGIPLWPLGRFIMHMGETSYIVVDLNVVMGVFVLLFLYTLARKIGGG